MQQSPKASSPNRIIRLPEVVSNVGISRSTIYSKIKDGTFPAPIQHSRRAVGWPVAVIEKWIEERIADSKGGTHAQA